MSDSEMMGQATNSRVAQVIQIFTGMSVQRLADHVCETVGPADQSQMLQSLLELQRNVTRKPDTVGPGSTYDRQESARKHAHEATASDSNYEVDELVYDHQFSEGEGGIWVSTWFWVNNEHIEAGNKETTTYF